MFFMCYFILQDSSDNTSLGKNSSDSSKLLIINHNLVFLIQLKAHPIHILLTSNFLWEKKRKRNNTSRCPSFLRNLSTNPPIVKDILNLSFLKNTKQPTPQTTNSNQAFEQCTKNWLMSLGSTVAVNRICRKKAL